MASEASGEDLSRQLEEADSFLKRHQGELATLEGVEHASLDFGFNCRIGTGPEGNEIVVQGEQLMPSLLKRCGDLGISIKLSLYPASNEKTANSSEQDMGLDAG